MSDFNYIQFIRDFHSTPMSEMTTLLMGTSLGKEFSNHSFDCIERGIKILDGEFSESEQNLVINNGIGVAIAAIMAEGDIADSAMMTLLMKSNAAKECMRLLFAYAIGLSSMEEIR